MEKAVTHLSSQVLEVGDMGAPQVRKSQQVNMQNS